MRKITGFSIFSFLKLDKAPEPLVLYCESLERRDMLSGISFDAGTGVVTLDGDNSLNDVGRAFMHDADTVQFELTGHATQQIDLSLITSIEFNGLGGNDSFTNDTAIQSRIVGGAGNDTLNGGSGDDLIIGSNGQDIINAGSGNDTVHGGNQRDTIYGGGGDDLLSGQNGDDVIHGHGGNDRLIGGNGNDEMHGDAGDDIFDGMSGDDVFYGDDGNDIIRGAFGDDELHGGNGQDILKGHFDNDTIYGDGGFDRIFGFTGDDILFGGDDRDNIYGNEGADTLNGGAGNDALLGGDGNDILNGNDGEDILRGENGNDQLNGGNHYDRLFGGNDNDVLRGDAGDDILYSDDGDDWAYGGLGADRIHGGAGDDALIGGQLGAIDILSGQVGDDRFLVQSGDLVTDQQTHDARIVFVDENNSWSDQEIIVIDRGLERLHRATNNTILLRDALPSGDLHFYKYASLNGALGINYLWSQTFGQNTTYRREIHFADWDETNAWWNDQFERVAIHELGHNWDGDLELTTVSSSFNGVWNQFLGLSGWTDANPNSSDYTQSLDGEWWYLNSAAFVWNYGRSNPHEDMSTLWEYYFIDYPENHDRPDLQSKIDLLDFIVQTIST